MITKLISHSNRESYTAEKSMKKIIGDGEDRECNLPREAFKARAQK